MPQFRVLIHDRESRVNIGMSQPLGWVDAVRCQWLFLSIFNYRKADIITDDALSRKKVPLLAHNFVFSMVEQEVGNVCNVAFNDRPWFCMEDGCNGV